MDFSIIVCTHNRYQRLPELLQSLDEMAASDALLWEILVIDNNSTDATKSVVATFSGKSKAPVRYIFEATQGKSFALNTGIRAARGEILAFTDDDATVDRLWLQKLKAAFDQFECAGVGGKVIPIWPSVIPAWFETKPPYNSMAAIVYFDKGDQPVRIQGTLIGANMAFRSEIFTKHGLFRTDLGPTHGDMGGGGEDSELCLRFCSAGEVLMYAPDAIVYHPVEEKRASKQYCRAWAFGHGKALARTKQIPGNAVRILGVPRYYLRFFLDAFCRWIFAVGQKKHFYFECKLWEILGEIAEFHRKSSDHS